MIFIVYWAFLIRFLKIEYTKRKILFYFLFYMVQKSGWLGERTFT